MVAVPSRPGSAGSEIRTVAPIPSSLAIATVPPWAAAMARTIARPSPAPPPLRPSSARVKRSNASGSNSGGKPSPASETSSSAPSSVVAGGQPDRRRPVAERVVDQVAQRLLDSQRIEIRRCAEQAPRPRSPARPRPHATRSGRERVRAAPSTPPARGRPGGRRGPSARSPADPPPAVRAGRLPRPPSAAPRAAPPASGPGDRPARAPSAGSRAACAARGWRPPRTRARVRVRPRCGRASRSASRRAGGSRRRRGGGGAARRCAPG